MFFVVSVSKITNSNPIKIIEPNKLPRIIGNELFLGTNRSEILLSVKFHCSNLVLTAHSLLNRATYCCS